MKEDTEFRERVTAYQEELKQLEAESLRTYTRRQSEINALVTNEMRLKEVSTENEELKIKVGQIEAANGELQKKLRLSQKKFVDCETHLKKVNETQRAEHETHVKSLQRAVDTLKAEIRAKVEHHESEVKRVSNESMTKLRHSDARYETLHQKFQQQEQENNQKMSHLVSQHLKSLDEEKVENMSKQSAIVSLKKEVEELKEKLELTNNMHTKEVLQLNTNLGTERAMVMAKEMVINRLEIDFKELNEKSFLDKMLSDESQSIKEKLVNTLKVEKAEMNLQIEGLNQQLITLKETYESNKVDMLKKICCEKKSKNEQEKELNDTKAHNIELRQKHDKLANEFEQLQSHFKVIPIVWPEIAT